MKNTMKPLFAGLLCLAFASGARAADVYQQLAAEITEAGAKFLAGLGFTF